MKQAMLVESLWVLGTRLIMRASNLVVFLLLARSLSVAEFGTYGYVVASILMLSVVADLGLRQSTAYVIGKGREPEPRILGQMALLWLVLATSMTLAMAVVMRMGPAAEGPVLTLLALAIAAPALLVRMGQGIFLGRGEIKALNQSELVSRAVVLFGVGGLWLLGQLTLEAALLLLLLGYIAAAAYLLWRVRQSLSLPRLGDLALARRLLAHGLGFAGGIIAMIMLGRVGIWILGAMLPGEAVGIYFGAMRLAEMMAEVATAVGVVIFSHGVRSEDSARAAGDAVRIARSVTALMALLAVPLGLGATPFLTHLMGEAYAAGATSFRILLAGAVMSCFSMMLYPSLSSQGRARLGLWLFGPGTAAAALLTWLLVPPLGVVGAAWALTAAQAVVAVAFIIAFHRIHQLPVHTIAVPQVSDLQGLARFLRAFPRRLQRA